ncbi:MAG: PepSY domain-containing protein [bacterium]|nr:PepSY domain-containing protein [bacterium]
MRRVRHPGKKVVYGLAGITAAFVVAAGAETLNSDKVLAANEQQASNTQKISEDEAVQIALDKAGVKKEDVKGLSVKLDRDEDRGNREVYEIDFTHKGTEYEVEIDPVTKKILYYEMDEKDD